MADIQWDQVHAWQNYWDWAKRQFLAGSITTEEYAALETLCKNKIKELTIVSE